METLLNKLTEELENAFAKAGYDAEPAKAVFSNRPDLCQFQCNGAMALAKKYHKAPIAIANEVAKAYESSGSGIICNLSAAGPGFLNFNVSPAFLKDYISSMSSKEDFGINKEPVPKTIIVDYGGPNVAKPLHIGHLRSAIIGEAVKRICRFMNNEVIGDIHLGDFGLQMGLIITELKKRNPELVYFDDDYTGEYPKEPPFTISELEEIYPAASAKSKEDEQYKADAMEATKKLQNGVRGYKALWQHIMDISVADLKKNYENLNVRFELWKGESDVQDDILPMVEKMKKDGFAYESDGALVVDVKQPDDTKEVPPCIVLKSDGAALYTTTDLATLLFRKETYKPGKVIYVVDKRQEMHFTQVFRCAKKTGCIGNDTELEFLGFGTMNGSDGKPFKTREGGVMRLEMLIKDINDEMYKKITSNHDIDPDEAKGISEIVALAAVKYGDLSNQATKDYIFDLDKFTSFEGNTGPYILYTIVRIKSILNKYAESLDNAGNTGVAGSFVNAGDTSIDSSSQQNLCLMEACSESETDLCLALTKLNDAFLSAYEELAPHKICAFIYETANAFNTFYHENRILSESDVKRKESYIRLLMITRDVLLLCIDVLGFSAPEHM